MDREPEIGFSGTRNQTKNGFKASWTKPFLIFAIFDYFSKWSILNVLQNFEKSSNIAKIWQLVKKSLDNLP